MDAWSPFSRRLLRPGPHLCTHLSGPVPLYLFSSFLFPPLFPLRSSAPSLRSPPFRSICRSFSADPLERAAGVSSPIPPGSAGPPIFLRFRRPAESPQCSSTRRDASVCIGFFVMLLQLFVLIRAVWRLRDHLARRCRSVVSQAKLTLGDGSQKACVTCHFS